MPTCFQQSRASWKAYRDMRSTPSSLASGKLLIKSSLPPQKARTHLLSGLLSGLNTTAEPSECPQNGGMPSCLQESPCWVQGEGEKRLRGETRGGPWTKEENTRESLLGPPHFATTHSTGKGGFELLTSCSHNTQIQ